MQRWRGFESLPPGWGRSVVTIGVFDGVHRGHQQTLQHVMQRAREADMPSVVVTFEPHPLSVIRPPTYPPVLTHLGYKAQLLENLGIDGLCVVPFTRSFSRLEPDEFAHHMLVENLHAGAVVVGRNFRFGHGAVGDCDLLAEFGRQYGFAVEPIDLAGDADTTWSSTYIRSCIKAGDVRAAGEALSRPHRVEGFVVRGERRGRELGYPTANLEPLPHSAVPGDGVYAGWFHQREDELPAAISIGTNPTFEGRERRVEAYVLDAELDLYGEHVALDFAERLRETVKFDGVESLKVQMAEDCRRAREILT